MGVKSRLFGSDSLSTPMLAKLTGNALVQGMLTVNTAHGTVSPVGPQRGVRLVSVCIVGMCLVEAAVSQQLALAASDQEVSVCLCWVQAAKRSWTDLRQRAKAKSCTAQRCGGRGRRASSHTLRWLLAAPAIASALP